MGGFGTKSKKEETTTTDARKAQGSTVIDTGLGDVQNLQITGSDGANVVLTDHGAVDSAFALANNSINEAFNFTTDALDFVNVSSERDKDFAENVAIPLQGQITEQFTKYIVAASAAVAIAMFYFTSKGAKA